MGTNLGNFRDPRREDIPPLTLGQKCALASALLFIVGCCLAACGIIPP